MQIIKYPERSRWQEILERPLFKTDQIEPIVMSLLKDVKEKGDAAIREHSKRIDSVVLDKLAVAVNDIDAAEGMLSNTLKESIHIAKNNIEKFHRSQQISETVIETTPGVKCWQKSVAIEKVGLYIPGGTAPLFSTVLMLGIPAVIAGCSEIVLCTPPAANGKVHPAILYTAKLIGIKKIYSVGGALAIGAMAYGTETIPQVYKIFGPGNQWVTTAKQLVSRENIAIDMPAGPSEVAVIADAHANPAFIAADMLSQAEHGKDSQVILFTTDEGIANKVVREINLQLTLLNRRDMAAASLENSKCIVCTNKDELMEMCNRYAPEHLIIETEDYLSYSEKVINAGSVFLGAYTPESAGDYASGTNHTLPTNGYAKVFSGVNLDSYIKKITFQHIDEEGLKKLGPTIQIMAENELLDAHKNAVTVRLNALK